MEVKMHDKDGQYNEWDKDDTGLVDGYINAGDNRPYAIVVLDKNNKFVFVPIYSLRRIK